MNVRNDNVARTYTGTVLLDRMLEDRVVLEIGCSGIDDLFGGGLYSGEISEFCGLPGTGKTQICLSAAAQCVAGDLGNVLYIDSGTNFSVARLRTYLQPLVSGGVNEDSLLGMVVCCISASAHELVDILSAVLRAVEGRDVEMTSILTEKEPPQLIIIDSISALLAPVLTTSARGHALMMSIATALRTLTREHNVIIITTNGVTKMHKNANYKSALGTSWIEVADTRITLQEPADTSQAIGVTQIEANVITSNRIQPKKGGIFQISGAGIT